MVGYDERWENVKNPKAMLFTQEMLVERYKLSAFLRYYLMKRSFHLVVMVYFTPEDFVSKSKFMIWQMI